MSDEITLAVPIVLHLPDAQFCGCSFWMCLHISKGAKSFSSVFTQKCGCVNKYWLDIRQ